MWPLVLAVASSLVQFVTTLFYFLYSFVFVLTLNTSLPATRSSESNTHENIRINSTTTGRCPKGGHKFDGVFLPPHVAFSLSFSECSANFMFQHDRIYGHVTRCETCRTGLVYKCGLFVSDKYGILSCVPDELLFGVFKTQKNA